METNRMRSGTALQNYTCTQMYTHISTRTLTDTLPHSCHQEESVILQPVTSFLGMGSLTVTVFLPTHRDFHLCKVFPPDPKSWWFYWFLGGFLFACLFWFYGLFVLGIWFWFFGGFFVNIRQDLRAGVWRDLRPSAYLPPGRWVKWHLRPYACRLVNSNRFFLAFLAKISPRFSIWL